MIKCIGVGSLGTPIMWCSICGAQGWGGWYSREPDGIDNTHRKTCSIRSKPWKISNV